MKRLIFFLYLGPILAAAQSQPPMTGPEFRELSEGYTLHFEDMTGAYFGSEQYFDDRKTLWRPRDGECERGVWAEDRGRICFLYVVGLACWKLFREGEGVTAFSANGEDGEIDDRPTQLRLRDRNKVPVTCEMVPSV